MNDSPNPEHYSASSSGDFSPAFVVNDYGSVEVNYNFDLSEGDLKPPTNFQYLKVMLFLVSTLIFWILIGWFASYEFPFGQAAELFAACFTGSVSSKITSFQRKVQNTDINQCSSSKLHKMENEAWMYSEVANHLTTDKVSGNQRVFEALEALKQIQKILSQELEKRPRRKSGYKTFRKIRETLTLLRIQRDYGQVIAFVDKLYEALSKVQPSESVNDILAQVSADSRAFKQTMSLTARAHANDIENLFEKVLSKKIGRSDPLVEGRNFERIINDLQLQSYHLTENIEALTRNKYELEEQLQRITSDRDGILSSLKSAEIKIGEQNQKISQLVNETRDKQVQLNSLENNLSNMNTELKKIQSDIDRLRQENSRLNDERNELINQFSQGRQNKLQGKYLGNIKNRNSKCHFNWKCDHYRSLVAEYLYAPLSDQLREIRNSRNPIPGLELCEKCQTSDRG